MALIFNNIKKQIISNNNQLEINNWKQIIKQAKIEKKPTILFNYIKKVENKINSKGPFIPENKISKLRKIINKIDVLNNLLKKAMILLKNSKDEKTKTKNDKLVQKIKLGISDMETYFWSYLSHFQNKFHAKLVGKIEKLKKPETKVTDPTNKNIVDLSEVTKYYFNKAVAFSVLDNVSLTIPAGKFVLILGPSGSGKTTLLNIISGMDKPTYGQVNVCGENLINKSQSGLTDFRRRNIAYIFQNYGLLPNLTVKENVELGASLQEVKKMRLNVNDTLRKLGIYEIKDKMPYELSGGQQQRCAIARSLVKNPNILFGDEPTGALDEKNSEEVIKIFKQINKEFNTTIILVTHNVALVEHADIVINVKNHKISISK